MNQYQHVSADRLDDRRGILAITCEWEMEELGGNLNWIDPWNISHKLHYVYCHSQGKNLHLICKNFTVWLDNENTFRFYRRLCEQYN